MSSSIEISLVVTNEAGHTTRVETIFEDTLARWPELYAEFGRFSEAVRKASFTEATTQRSLEPDNYLNPTDIARDYGVHSMTPGEVQRMLELKDRDNHAAAEQILKLEHDLRLARESRGRYERDLNKVRNELKGASKQVNQLRDELRIARENRNAAQRKLIEAERERDQPQEENARLREAVTGLQQTNAALNQRNAELNADLRIRRQNVEDLTRQNEALQHRNDNQSRTIAELTEKVRLYEAGAPGVADLNKRYNELHQQVWDGADEDTKLQDERDVARRERDNLIVNNHAISERLNELQLALDATVRAKSEGEERLVKVAEECRDAKNLVQDLRARLSQRDNRIDRQEVKIRKHVGQLELAEQRYQELKGDAEKQAGEIGQKLVTAVEASKAAIMADRSNGEWLIHKNDANSYIDGILKAVAPKDPEEGKAPPL